ncbi:MAG: PIG-L family deacetylase, partial [Clostridia bacterium]|nr:PIG-L family deacetylase [Clostridia bacterium]
ASPDGGNVTIEIPSWTQPGGLTVEWLKSFPGFELKEYGRDGALINTVDGADCFPAYITYLDLNSETAKIVISVPSGTRISEITVYSRGTYDGTRQKWLNPAEKADIMLIVAHQDDEELWFGGLLPYYDSVLGKNVQVVYMTDCGRPRVREALNGLWVMGMRTLPEVIGFEDDYSTVKDSIKLWGGESRIEYELVRVIRLFKPEVIVTHDINGEYGHPQHRLTAQMMERAIAVAADPDKYPDLTKRYGA